MAVKYEIYINLIEKVKLIYVYWSIANHVAFIMGVHDVTKKILNNSMIEISWKVSSKMIINLKCVASV